MNPEEVQALIETIDIPLTPDIAVVDGDIPYTTQVQASRELSLSCFTQTTLPTYLVVLRTSMGDLPLAIFDRNSDATLFARDVYCNHDLHRQRFNSKLPRLACLAGLHSVGVVEFTGPLASAYTELWAY